MHGAVGSADALPAGVGRRPRPGRGRCRHGCSPSSVATGNSPAERCSPGVRSPTAVCARPIPSPRHSTAPTSGPTSTTPCSSGAGALARFAAASPSPIVDALERRGELAHLGVLRGGRRRRSSRTQIAPADLVLELTEHVPLRDGEAIEVLRAIRSLGVGLAIDDIGENPSLFLAFRRVGLDWVKFERHVQSRGGQHRRGGGSSGASSTWCTTSGAAVVAEGIETAEMLRRSPRTGLRSGAGKPARPGGVGRDLPAGPARRRCCSLR